MAAAVAMAAEVTAVEATAAKVNTAVEATAAKVNMAAVVTAAKVNMVAVVTAVEATAAEVNMAAVATAVEATAVVVTTAVCCVVMRGNHRCCVGIQRGTYEGTHPCLPHQRHWAAWSRWTKHRMKVLQHLAAQHPHPMGLVWARCRAAWSRRTQEPHRTAVCLLAALHRHAMRLDCCPPLWPIHWPMMMLVQLPSGHCA